MLSLHHNPTPHPLMALQSAHINFKLSSLLSTSGRGPDKLTRLDIYSKKEKRKKKETWNGSFFPPGLNGHFRVETLSCRYCSFGSTEQTAKHSGIIKPFPRWHSGKHQACCTERENGGKDDKTWAVTQTHSKKRKSPMLTHNLWGCLLAQMYSDTQKFVGIQESFSNSVKDLHK